MVIRVAYRLVTTREILSRSVLNLGSTSIKARWAETPESRGTSVIGAREARGANCEHGTEGATHRYPLIDLPHHASPSIKLSLLKSRKWYYNRRISFINLPTFLFRPVLTFIWPSSL